MSLSAARRPRSGPDLVRIYGRRRHCATPSISPSRRSGSATPGTGSPSITSTRASPGRRRPWCSRSTAAATSTIRLGSGAVQLGHRTALSTVEEFGLLDALHPGRFDLGLGRSGGKPRRRRAAGATPAPAALSSTGVTRQRAAHPADVLVREAARARRGSRCRSAAQLPGAQPQDYTEQVDDILALLAGTYRTAEGVEAHVVPGEGADLQIWILGSSGGESAEVAGKRGLRFAANYHVSPPPCSMRSTPTGRRSAFGRDLGPPVRESPPMSSSPTTRRGPGNWPPDTACGCAASAPPKGRSRSRRPDEARRHAWTDDERELVAGPRRHAVRRLAGAGRGPAGGARAATGADELLVTTITHDHEDRVRSYELLAAEWARRGRQERI